MPEARRSGEKRFETMQSAVASSFPAGFNPRGLFWGSLLALLFLAACTPRQLNNAGRYNNLALEPKDLPAHGVAFITPSTVTGQEEDREALALIFAASLRERRPDIPLVTLSETLGQINRNGLADEYRQMFVDYRYTGIFRRETLLRLGEITGARYLAQIKLANFTQGSHGRLSVLGLRLAQTKEGNIRLLLTIWDSRDGSIAWEGMQEVNYAYDTFLEKPITFKQAVEEAVRELIRKFPS